MQAADVFYAYKQVTKVVYSMKTMRSSTESEFSLLFHEASNLGKALHGEEFKLSLPRINSRKDWVKIKCSICQSLTTPQRLKELVQLFRERHPRRMKLPFVFFRLTTTFFVCVQVFPILCTSYCSSSLVN